MHTKVWGIGLSRTGTTTLAYALEILGFKSGHFVLPRYFDNYDAVTDVTVSVRYKDLDRRYPGSKFILTTREIEGWLASYERHIRRRQIPKCDSEWLDEILHCRRTLYGTIGFDPELCRRSFHRHNNEVTDYFMNRDVEFLQMDIIAGDGWDKLCEFIGHPRPSATFPWKNSS
jgi:hypothetical protein